MTRRASATWQYFNKKKEGNKASNWVCVICKTLGSCKNISNLWKHLGVNHEAIHDQIKQGKQPAKQRWDESHRLLDDDDERVGEVLPLNNDDPSVAAAPNNADPSSASAASAASDHTTAFYRNNKKYL